MAGTLADKSATQLLSGFKAKRFTPIEVLDAVASRIHQCNPLLNAFQLLDLTAARRAARVSATRWAKGQPRGLLDGVPIAIKDVTETKGWPTLNGSTTVDPKGPWREDAVVVERFRAHGAVIIGKTATPEFAWRSITESKLNGVTRNPWNPDWTPCGSSGGSAAAVAAGMVAVATGTDSGGSVRGPASFCNLVGLKPTFGRVPVWPMSPMMSMEHCGPLTRTVRDAALAMNVMAGFDPRDGFALNEVTPDYLRGLSKGVKGLRIGYSADLGVVPVQPGVQRVVAEARRVFADLGARVSKVGLDLRPARHTSAAICGPLAARVKRDLGCRSSQLTGPDLLRAASRGEKLSALEMLDGEAGRCAMRAQMAQFHTRYDLLIAPTVAVAPFPVGQDNPSDWRALAGSLDWMDTMVPFNVTGQPAVSVPCGFTPDGAPVGLQIIGPFGNDALVLQAAYAFEQAHPVGRIRPPIGIEVD